MYAGISCKTRSCLNFRLSSGKYQDLRIFCRFAVGGCLCICGQFKDMTENAHST